MAEQKGLSSDAEIRAALEELPGWKQQGKTILKTFDLKGFKAAMAFAGTVGELADRADHHPDILIQYSKVTLTLWSTTRAAGRIEACRWRGRSKLPGRMTLTNNPPA